MLIQKLDEKHLGIVRVFSCVETPETVANLNSKQRRRVLLHSREMDDFLHNEVMSEQEHGTNTTHLLIDNEAEKLVAYISLCADSIPLGVKEREEEMISYSNAPALKIARLAVASSYQRQGFCKKLLRFALRTARNRVKRYCGIVFLTLDCYEHRVAFYEHLGFQRNQIQTFQREYDSPISMRANINALANRVFNSYKVAPSV